MTVKVSIPAVLRPAVGGAKAVQAQGGTLRELLQGLANEYPDLKTQFFGDDGSMHKFVNIYVNDEDARYLDEGMDTALDDDDVVAILPAVAGGWL